MKIDQPATPAEWLEEIEVAIADAAGEPFARLIREPDRAVNLFHLAPMVCMKFRGLAYLRLKNFDSAIQDANAALKIDKTSADARSNLGLVYQEMGDLDRAMACFNDAITTDKEHAESRLNRGTIFYRKGKPGAARQDWIDVLKLDSCGSAGQAAQRNLAKMMRDQKKGNFGPSHSD